MLDHGKQRRKAERYEFWYDQMRRRMLSFYAGKPLPDCFAMLMDNNWAITVASAYAMYRAHLAGKPPGTMDSDAYQRALLALEAGSNIAIGVINHSLPYPIPRTVPLLDGFMNLVAEHKDELVPYLQHPNPMPLAPERSGPLNYITMAASQIFGTIADELIYGEPELMVIDGDLVQRVLKSSNDPDLSPEDLEHVPFRRTVVEFSRPVRFASGCGVDLDATAAGFYNGGSNGTYAVVWYTTLPLPESAGAARKTAPVVLSAVYVTSIHGFHRVCLDNDVSNFILTKNQDRYHIGVNGNNGITAVYHDGNHDLATYRADCVALERQIRIASHNLWDLLTSRSIDYEDCRRGANPMAKMRQYQHLQGAAAIGPRVYKILKLDRTEKTYDPTGAGRQTAPGEQVHVPGCFHKWVYCRTCTAVHRHDLIGQPCRKCGTQVGPISNIEVRKWWHSDYWRGEGPVRQTIYGVE